MKLSNQIVTLVVIVTTSCITSAVEVYESDDQQGVVEFSDQASPGARGVDIHPNVVNVAPVGSVDSSSSAAATQSVTEAADSGQLEVRDKQLIHDYDEENRHVTQGGESRHVTEGGESRHVTEDGDSRHVTQGGERRHVTED